MSSALEGYPMKQIEPSVSRHGQRLEHRSSEAKDTYELAKYGKKQQLKVLLLSIPELKSAYLL